MGSHENGVEMEWVRPDLPSRCTYELGVSCPADSPHYHKARESQPAILPDILAAIGDTPLVRINKITKDSGLECEILAKCEFFNAGGSVKDRVSLRMVEAAERDGTLKPGDTLIEPTSGNTGIALAMVCAVRGYRCIIVMPEKMSQEKADVMTALGAEIIRTPSTRYDTPESHVCVAYRLKQQIPNSHVLDQYHNANNPLVHYDETAEEILQACDGRVDMIVAGAGTGGTIAGIARKVKETCPNCKIIGVDPLGSVIALPEALNKTDVGFYEVEGTGKDFIPTVCDRNYVDRWYKSADKESFQMSRRLIKEEGFLCGGSSGGSMYCALQAAKDFGMKKGDRVVVICPDSIRNYMTKFLNDDWMVARDFMDIHDISSEKQIWWSDLKVSALALQAPTTVRPDVSIRETLAMLSQLSVDQLPIVDSTSAAPGGVVGMVTTKNLMAQLSKGKVTTQDTVSKALLKQFRKVSTDVSLGCLSRMLNQYQFVLVINKEEPQIQGVITHLDLLNFIAQKELERRGADNIMA